METTKWPNENTRFLIACYAKRVDKFRDPKIKKSTLWKEIVAAFAEKGFSYSLDDVSNKFRNLKKTFVAVKSRKNTSGDGQATWNFYDEFEEIFSSDKTVNHGTTFSFVDVHCNPSVCADNEPSTSTTTSPTRSFDEYWNLPPDSEILRNRLKRRGVLMLLAESEEKKIKILDKLAETAAESLRVQKERNKQLAELVRTIKFMCEKT